MDLNCLKKMVQIIGKLMEIIKKKLSKKKKKEKI